MILIDKNIGLDMSFNKIEYVKLDINFFDIASPFIWVKAFMFGIPLSLKVILIIPILLCIILVWKNSYWIRIKKYFSQYLL
jgi:hypothetical protein